MLCALAPLAGAGELVTNAKPCAKTIRVDADSVPLGQVLERLSQAMEFQLTVQADADEPVSMHREGPPDELLRRLTRDRNAVVRTAASERCKGRETVARIWVLPKGADAPRDVATTPAPAAHSAPAPAVTPAPAVAVPAPARPSPPAHGRRVPERTDGGEAPLPRDLHHLERATPPGYLRKKLTPEQWQQMKADYKAGRIRANPETGEPERVDQ